MSRSSRVMVLLGKIAFWSMFGVTSRGGLYLHIAGLTMLQVAGTTRVVLLTEGLTLTGC